jgi:hypothetical protein
MQNPIQNPVHILAAGTCDGHRYWSTHTYHGRPTWTRDILTSNLHHENIEKDILREQ